MKKKLITLMILPVALMLFVSSVLTVNADGTWQHDANGWWYKYSDGSYAKDVMLDIDGQTYVFDTNGYMIHDAWHYRP